MFSTPLPVTSLVSVACSQEYATKLMAPRLYTSSGCEVCSARNTLERSVRSPARTLTSGTVSATRPSLRVVLATDQAVDVVTFLQQQLGQVQSILAGDTGDK